MSTKLQKKYHHKSLYLSWNQKAVEKAQVNKNKDKNKSINVKGVGVGVVAIVVQAVVVAVVVQVEAIIVADKKRRNKYCRGSVLDINQISRKL